MAGMPAREGGRHRHRCHLPRGLSVGGCEQHWPGLLARVGLKSEGREGQGTRRLCRPHAQAARDRPGGTRPPRRHPGAAWPPTISYPEVSEKALDRRAWARVFPKGQGSPASGKVSRASPVPGPGASGGASCLGLLLRGWPCAAASQTPLLCCSSHPQPRELPAGEVRTSEARLSRPRGAHRAPPRVRMFCTEVKTPWGPPGITTHKIGRAHV